MDATANTQQTDGSEAANEEQAQVQTEVADEDMSDEAKLAAEALEATDEPAGETPTPEIEALKKVNDGLLGSITARRHFLRELDKTVAERVEAEKAAIPPEKTPEEKYIEDNHDSFDPDAESFPASVQTAQRKFDKEQSAKERKAREETDLTKKASMSSVEAHKKFKDFDEILLGAQDLITDGDQLDLKKAIAEGKDGAEFLYRRCIFKTLESGGDRAKQLRAKLKAKVPAKASVQKQSTKQTDGTEQKPAGQEKVTTPAADLEKNPTLSHIYAAFGVDE